VNKGGYQFEQRPCGIAPTASDNDYMFRREPNPWGLFDMAGNVWELCRDRYGNYTAGDVTDPLGPTSGTARVARGGAFDTTATQCRAAARLIVEDPNRAARNVGFRLVYGPKIAEK
jgi:formylglycine-generating enzyme required for sulfatase activity